jgi:phosphoglycolate phosphatase-like HAD superfamily hydrolase
VTLFLFDIDGTLLLEHPRMLEPYARAVRDVLGSTPENQQIRMAGRTDLSIFATLLAAAGTERPDALGGDLTEAYHRHLEAHLALHPRIPVSGARQFLATLIDANTYLGLATGNTPTAASLKLESAEMGEIFTCGAYAGAGPERSSILRSAIQDCQSTHEQEFDSIVYFGDTPSDIAAARAVGAVGIGVAAGTCSRDELAGARPELLISSFEEIDLLSDFLSDHLLNSGHG